ncbi:MAG: type I DNA topoisomerase [Lachnospiraceae bacterium]|nr:type I DNA topoisomerase [Lachnospiraceae bacterium]
MAKNLVIVESPAKVKTIKKFLGKTYEVVASNGHVRDFPKSQMGIDFEHDYEPKYITIRGKGDLLSALRKEAKKADKIYLATDPDREGEAISWHLITALKLEDKDVSRISFNEITKTAVKNSLKNPREIDMNLVNSQQARRMLDRMVGYEISPLLWAKVKRGLSAGRVQSVALRIICNREQEIDAFIPKEYYTLDASILAGKAKKPFVAAYYGTRDSKKKAELNDKATVDKIKKEVSGKDFLIDTIKKSNRERKTPLPFTTSTLQQEAFKALNFNIQKTMRVAQTLYEDGIITYLRTDSTRVSDEAKEAAFNFIIENYGADFHGEGSVKKKEGAAKVQDAHECIRPSDINRTPTEMKDKMSRDEFRLYQLIWRRFTASQMSAARYENTNVRLLAGDHVFTASSSNRMFDGFMLIYSPADEEDEEKNPVNDLTEESVLTLKELSEKQHFTQPPAHFTEASLVSTLEELGIGRPSTYSPTITTLQKRRYILKEGKSIFVTELGEAVNDIMTESFPSIVNEQFTANMESLLDGIEEGNVDWKSVVKNFYPDLEESVRQAEKDLEKVEIRDEETDIICENCGRNMVIKYGPHGKFLACPGFPECRNTKPYLEKIDVKCPKCGKDIVIRKTKKGRRFYGCEDYPTCDFTSWQKPVNTPCPKCGSYMVEKGQKAVCQNPECGYAAER